MTIYKNIELVKKSYEELQDEVIKLTTDKFILQSNWDSLREDIQRKKDILDKDQAFRFNHQTKFKLDILNYVLNKMNELEGIDK